MRCLPPDATLRILVVLRHVFGDAVKMPAPDSTPSTVINWRKLPACPTPLGPNATASSFTTNNPTPILISVEPAVHIDAFASDISGKAQDGIDYRTLIDIGHIVEQR